MRILSLLLLTAGTFTICGFAAEQTWTGKISDSSCGASHNKMAEHGKSAMSGRDCTLACVKGGGKYVFVEGGKVYNVENQDAAGLQEHAGHTVRLTGEMNGDSIKVSKIEMASGGAHAKKAHKST
jgi:hypothetical protein